MTLFEFKHLTEVGQAEVLQEQGVHIATRDSLFHTLVLYQIDSFYVEVVYHRLENKIIKIRSFLSTYALEPYLEKIDLSDIL